MSRSWFVMVMQKTFKACQQFQNRDEVQNLKGILFDIYNLPMLQVKQAQIAWARRKAESDKVCEICGEHYQELIKSSDVMCRHCKLEISLGRQIKPSNRF